MIELLLAGVVVAVLVYDVVVSIIDPDGLLPSVGF